MKACNSFRVKTFLPARRKPNVPLGDAQMIESFFGKAKGNGDDTHCIRGKEKLEGTSPGIDATLANNEIKREMIQGTLLEEFTPKGLCIFCTEEGDWGPEK